MLTQDWTADATCFQVQDPLALDSSDLSDDPFDSYEQWDPSADSSQQPTQINLLKLLDWDGEKPYDEDPPIYTHYSTEWKVTMNNRAIMPKDTEQDVVLAPATVWQQPTLARAQTKQFFAQKEQTP